jgi:hypothetical protein
VSNSKLSAQGADLEESTGMVPGTSRDRQDTSGPTGSPYSGKARMASAPHLGQVLAHHIPKQPDQTKEDSRQKHYSALVTSF